MTQFTTQIRAFDPTDGELKLWMGPNIPAVSFADARKYCDNNGLGYCEIIGILDCEIDERTGMKTDYRSEQNN